MFVIIVGRMLQFAIALATIKLATTYLTPSEMGKVSLLISSIAFFVMLFINPIGQYINRNLHEWIKSKVFKIFLRYYYSYLLLVAFISALFVSFFDSYFGIFEVSAIFLGLVFFFSVFFNTLNQTFIPSINLMGNSFVFIVLTVLTLTVSLFFAFSLVIVFDTSAEMWLSGIVIGQVIVGIFAGIYFYRTYLKGECNNTFQLNTDEIIRFSIPLAISALFFWLQFQGYRFIVEAELGFTELGLFVAGYGISAGIIAAVESVFTAKFQPDLYRNVSEEKSKLGLYWSRYTTLVVPSLILIGSVLCALSEELSSILLGSSFYDAKKYVFYGALVEVVRAVISVFLLLPSLNMKTGRLISPNAIGAFLSMVLAYNLAPLYGGDGVALALLLSALFVMLILIYLYRNYVELRVIYFLIKCAVPAFLFFGFVEVVRYFEIFLFFDGFFVLSFGGFFYLLLQLYIFSQVEVWQWVFPKRRNV